MRNKFFFPYLTKVHQRAKPFVITVQDNGCWYNENHVGMIFKGYGRIRWGTPVAGVSPKKRLHRLMYEFFNGPIPEWGIICHHCDDPRCINPEHLFLGTHYDNAHDKISKGRQKTIRGEAVALSKLKSSDVLEMRALRAKGNVSYRTLAKRYGVDWTTVRRAVLGETWGHL